ncbi:hypothetical protein GPA22_21520 [Aromatoleum toluvorans]|uniref:Uncharacterized protein n=1 Tax=Aromatoleum toluvorans TaxID=92002 RepID=A0ABX1Q3S7_9RHOO|nr:hypothetical protein [Aromatoleum toluvorans]NMG46303.1 hypothetical protein [Aromatoleum toluvorans]
MSYILEALQKSEHARQRGRVPDLNTLPETAPDTPDHVATRRPPYVAAVFALTLAAAVLGWWRPWQAAEPKPSAPIAATKPPVDDPRPLDAAGPPKQQSVATAPQVTPDKPAEPGPVAAAPAPAESPAVPPSVPAAAPAAPSFRN